MLITATQKFTRISPRKLRLVANSIKHLRPSEAVRQLQFMNKKSATVLQKVINQAINNATNNQKLNPDSHHFHSIQINEGVTYKRWQPVSRGRAHSIFKRSSHITVTLESKVPTTPQSQSTAQTKPEKLPPVPRSKKSTKPPVPKSKSQTNSKSK